MKRRDFIIGSGVGLITAPAIIWPRAAFALSPQQRVVLFSGQRAALDLNFATLTSLPSYATFTRTSAATSGRYTDAAGASFTSYLSGVPRLLSGVGILIEPQATNSLLNSDAPATQTTGSLATGTYVLFGNGSGTLTSLAGTATGTGFGTISTLQGNFQTITITGAGTVTITKGGTVNWFDLQNLSLPTTHISTAGSTATRNAETLSIPLSSIGIPANPTGLTVLAKAMTQASNPSVSNRVIAINDRTGANQVTLFRATNASLSALVKAGNVIQFQTIAQSTAPQSTTFSEWLAINASGRSLQVIGQPLVTGGAITMPSGLTTLSIGNDPLGAEQWNSTISRLVVYRSRLSDSVAAQKAAGL